MSEPFLGEIRLFAGGVVPDGWARCDGQLLPIQQNQALFSVIGTLYGGDGRIDFALPNLSARAPIHHGEGPGLANRGIAEAGGTEYVTLQNMEMPPHAPSVALKASSKLGQTANPSGAILATPDGGAVYASPSELVPMNPQAVSVSSVGGGQPHENRQPFLALSFLIATKGEYPSQK